MQLWLQHSVHEIDYRLDDLQDDDDYQDDVVRISHAHGSLMARHVVLALPPSLAVHHITFRPALPEQLHALAIATLVWMSNIAKVVLVYRAAFWRRDGLAGAAISHLGPLREIHDMSGPGGVPAALFGFAPLAPGRRAPTEEEVIAQLVNIFGRAAAVPTEVIIKDWRADSHTVPPDTGADISISTPGMSRLGMSTYGHPWYQEPAGDGRLHWASTETAPTSPGHIEGAITAAEPRIAPELEALMDSATIETDRGSLPPIDHILEYRTLVAERIHFRIGQIDDGAVGAPNQLRLIAKNLLAAIINHEYQHSKWIEELRTDTFGLDAPAPPTPPWLSIIDGYVMLVSDL